MFYEVFIPSGGAEGFDVTITVEADNWMTALKSGLERTGQGVDAIRNVMCDIKSDNTIHVTDAITSRVFVLHEVGDDIPEVPADAVVLELEDEPPVEELYPDDFATQKMEPIKPLTGKAPVLNSSQSENFESRERTLPRYRPGATPPTPPPEATGKFERASGPQTAAPPAAHAPPPGAGPPRTTSPSGVHAPPPGAAPPPRSRQTGQNPAAAPPLDELESRPAAQAVAASAPPAYAPPPPAASPAPQRVTQPEPVAQPQPVAQPNPVAQPQPEFEALGDLESDSLVDIPMDGGGLEERSWTSDDGRMRIGSSTFEALRREEPAPKVMFETRAPSGQRPAVQIGRPAESVSQSALEEVFLEINQIHEGEMTMEQVINFVMDLSMGKIRAEAGSIMFADVNGHELYFATARGPKAHEVMDFRVPMTKGLVGFCAREGVSLAISDAEKDPRFFKEISVKLGYETRNLCCAPIQFEGRVYGAIELMNKEQPFSNTEVNVLTYIGRQLAKFVNDLIMAREKI